MTEDLRNGVRVYRKERIDGTWSEWVTVGTFYDDDDAYREQVRLVKLALTTGVWTRTKAVRVENGRETYKLGGELSSR